MTQIMRERLARAMARGRALDPDAPGDEPPQPNWMDFLDDIDAIPAELRVPDDGMTIAIGRLGMDLGRQPTIAEAYPAMIDAVREGK